jgi:hypothetical protein
VDRTPGEIAALRLHAPSSEGQDANTFFKKNAVLMNRPTASPAAVPPELVVPMFSLFLDRMRVGATRPDAVIDSNDRQTVKALCAAMTDTYPSEKERVKAFDEIISDYMLKKLPAIAGMAVSVEFESIKGGSKADVALVLKPDRLAGSIFGFPSMPLILFEFKNEMGRGNCDADIEAATFYARQVAAFRDQHQRFFSFPCFIVKVIGPWIGVSAAYFAEQTVCLPLTPLFPMISSCFHYNAELKVTLLFRALVDAVSLGIDAHRQAAAITVRAPPLPFARKVSWIESKLDTEAAESVMKTESETAETEAEPNSGDRPAIRQSVAYDDLIYGVSARIDARKLIFRARSASAGKDFIVKFTRRYAKRVHDTAYERGFAPRLYCVQHADGRALAAVAAAVGEDEAKAEADDTLWKMVVMEPLASEFTPLDDAQLTDYLNKHAMRRAIKLAIVKMTEKIYEEQHFVHGDVRRNNVFLSKIKFDECVKHVAPGTATAAAAAASEAPMDVEGNEQPLADKIADELFNKRALQLIDFDWAGKSGVVRFPFEINMTGNVRWPNGVAPLAPITIEQQRELIHLEFWN